MSWRGKRAARMQTPPALASCLARLPHYPGAWLFARALNGAVAPQLLADVRQALEGKRLCLRLNDAGLRFDFGWHGERFIALPSGQPTDLCISCAVHELWLMARREEDPDSLFFQRRLALEGDTELGLLFKNTMDAIDFSALDLLLRRFPAWPARS